jgi:hypothetical protein
MVGRATTDNDLEVSGKAEKKPARFKNGSAALKRLSANKNEHRATERTVEDNANRLR